MTHYKQQGGVYIIAEIGVNHNGSIAEAKKLIDAAATAGANAVKFQVRDFNALYVKSILDDPLKAEQGTQYILNELKKAYLSNDDIAALFEYTKQYSVDFFATPFDIPSANFLNELGIGLFKIGSPDFTNLPLIAHVEQFGKPMILSTGMCEEAEIRQVVGYLKTQNADFALLHCNSTYPVFIGDINLRYMPKLAELSGMPVGYSGHEKGYLPTLSAVSLGAKIIERHITLDVEHTGPDHSSSLNSRDFTAMVLAIRAIEELLGTPTKKYNQGERNNYITLAKSLVFATELPAGHVISARDLLAKSPAKGISPLKIANFIGKTLSCAVDADEYVSESCVTTLGTEFDAVEIQKTWGIVGRLGDFRDYLDMQPDLVEMHMTWRDLMNYQTPEEIFSQDLVVHAPEYYQDQLIDFATEDKQIVEYSMDMLKKTIEVARDLANCFQVQNPQGPRVVLHPGGHFKEATQSNLQEQYRLLKKHLHEVDTEGVQILVENMSPYPWYFGGQWHNTIFMNAKEIAQFAEDMGWQVCFDTSHAKLYCNAAGIKFEDFINAIKPYVGYLHISDAAGVTGEGVQIGEGDIDFVQLFTLLADKNVGFIPEIWLGHLQSGKGFKIALQRIEQVMKKIAGESCHIHGQRGYKKCKP